MIVLLCLFIIISASLVVSQIPMPVPASSPLLPPSVMISETLKKEITVLAVGDIMLGRHCNVQMKEKNDWSYPFLKTAKLTQKKEIAFANLEAPFVQNCPTSSTGMIFCAPFPAIEGLKFAGINLVSLANNHILNYGQEGLTQTKELLDQNQISYTDSQRLTFKNIDGVDFGFLAFDLVTYPQTEIISKVKENKNLVDVLIVSLHWGAEYQPKPNKQQEILAHQLIDNGVKVVLGHHPHVIQPIEEYNHGLIFYSLGNFVFDQDWSEETKKGEIAEIIFEEKEIKSYRTVPVYMQNFCQPQSVN